MAQYKRERDGKFAGSIGSGKDSVPRPSDDIPRLPFSQEEQRDNPYAQTQAAPAPPPPPPGGNNYDDLYKRYASHGNDDKTNPKDPDAYASGGAGWVAAETDLPNGSDMSRDPEDYLPGDVPESTARQYMEMEATDGYTGESVGLMKDRKTGQTVARRCESCDGVGCYNCDGDGWIDMRDHDDDEDDEDDEGTCRTEGCDGDPNDGDSYDGYCGNCADRIYSSDNEGGMSDVEADADTLASAGMGTDEDYGYYGGGDDF